MAITMVGGKLSARSGHVYMTALESVVLSYQCLVSVIDIRTELTELIADIPSTRCLVLTHCMCGLGCLQVEEKENSDEKEETKTKKGCTDDEVVAVLSHELGHWSLNHVLKNFVIGQVSAYHVTLAVCS